MRENPNPDFKPKQVRNPGLGRLAKFQNGKLTNDFAWQMLTGVPDGQQGFMYGQFDNDGKMTGDDVGKDKGVGCQKMAIFPYLTLFQPSSRVTLTTRRG